ISHAKAVIITTSSDKVNLLTSQVIRADYGEKRIVARTNSTSSLAAFAGAGIETMSPTHAVAAILENMLLRPSLFKLMAMKNNSEDEKIDEVRVTSARGIGRNLAALNLRGCLVVAVRRDGKLIPPNGATVLRFNDTLTLLGDGKSLKRAEKILQVED
ncbi:MAG TPA: TrkA C-terminal domain-containing protein, partial [Pyrinomonadaceae bacterium]|nr:TrkA C-terminal domain-containing protein [Pyrinomonadaceae bacterium]